MIVLYCFQGKIIECTISLCNRICIGTTPWSTGRKLQFIENNKILSVHPNIIIIVVHLIKHDECCSMDKCECKVVIVQYYNL